MKKLRPIGLARGMGKIKKSFFCPLTEEEFLMDAQTLNKGTIKKSEKKRSLKRVTREFCPL